MEMKQIVNQYFDKYMSKYGNTALPGHLKALHSIRNCRTEDSGEIYISCTDCHHSDRQPLSCGHRSCPQCQNHESTRWIERQSKKLLPVQYFMVTFTLPYELRPLVYRNQRCIFSIFFACVSSTLKDFGLNPKHLGAELGMTMVLHTHSRELNYHPHIHVVVPGGGIDTRRRQWKKKKGEYLFNQDNLALVFRARFLSALNNAGFSIPRSLPKEWVVDCKHVGRGITAVKYLSRYLYRGVISEKNIVANQHGRVTFRFIESESGDVKYRTLDGEDFLHLTMHHVLPKGFRRVRDYGFLHGNAKKLLGLIQLILHVRIIKTTSSPRPVFICPCCKSPMIILGFRHVRKRPG